jgi:hypothetical protein
MRCITFIISSLIFMGLSTTYELSSKLISKDKVSIKVFRLNSKKEINKKELMTEEGYFFCCEGGDGDDLDRIEIVSKDNNSISVIVEDTESQEVKLKVEGVYLGNYKDKVSFHIFPWVNCMNSRNNTVKIYNGEDLIFQFKYYSSVCD